MRNCSGSEKINSILEIKSAHSMGNYISSTLVAPPVNQTERPETEVDESFFNPSSLLYFGPSITVAPSSAQDKLKNSHFLDPRNALWYTIHLTHRSDVWSTLAANRTIDQQTLAKDYQSPYTATAEEGDNTSTTLHALVNLKKSSLKLQEQDFKFNLKFSFDASLECLVRIYCLSKEVVVVDSKTGQPKATKNIM